jgi:NAD(P)-dependent dehydrogenase (short-subunit alcohol dehydrogenase family)
VKAAWLIEGAPFSALNKKQFWWYLVENRFTEVGNNFMDSLLAGKCAVVTGAGRGQGREIALAMAIQGVKVVVNDLGVAMDGSGFDRSPADQVAAEINQVGGTAIADYSNVADFDAADRIISTCVTNFGKIDILVNCAAITGKPVANFWEVDKANWDEVIAVNLNGTFNMCRHALARMTKQKTGRIINFSSPSWLGNMAGAYTASKGAIVSFSVGLAQELELGG